MSIYDCILCGIVCASPFILIYCICCGILNAYKSFEKHDSQD